MCSGAKEVMLGSVLTVSKNLYNRILAEQHNSGYKEKQI